MKGVEENMSYYKGEEVTYLGSINGNGGTSFESDFVLVDTIGDRYDIQYYVSYSFKKGDIIYFSDSVDFPTGGYFKAKIDCSFSSAFYNSSLSAQSDFCNSIFNQTADYVNYGGESIYFEYLGKNFSLSQLTDELPTEKPTEKPTEAPTEKPTEKPAEVPTEPQTEAPAELPTSGEVLETSYDFSSLVIKNADEIIDNSMGFVPSVLVSVIPIGIVAFAVGFGIKKAMSYFRTLGRGGH